MYAAVATSAVCLYNKKFSSNQFFIAIMYSEIIKQPPIMGHSIEIEIITGAQGISVNHVVVRVRAKRGFYIVQEFSDVLEQRILVNKRKQTLMLLWLTMGKMLYEELYVEETPPIQQSA